MYLRTTTLALTLLASVSSVHALEGKALLEKFVADAAKDGRQISWGSLTEENSSSFILTDVVFQRDNGDKMDVKNVVVRGLKEADGRVMYDTVTITSVESDTEEGGKFAVKGLASTDGNLPVDIWEDGLTAEEKRERITFGNFTINGVAISNQGVNVTLDAIAMTKADIPLDFRYEPEQINNADTPAAAPATFDQFAITGLKGSQQGVEFGMQSFSIANAKFPTTLHATPHDWMSAYTSASINGISASMGGTEVFGMGTLSATIAPPADDGTISSNTVMDGLMINLMAIPDPNTQAVAQQLGYEKVEGSLSGIGSYNPKTGATIAKDLILKLNNMFDLSFDYAISGYTAEVAQKFSQAQFEVAGGKNPGETYGAILPDLAGVKLDTLKLALTDQSLTGKLLDFQAAQMGTTGDQLAAGAPMMIGLGMGGLNMPALTEMVTSAVGTFLKDKGTLTVEATPGAPVSLVDLYTTGQSDPTKLPDLVNLKISAQ